VSLLPNQILPETEPIGKADKSGSVVATHNWYLFFYNLASKILSTPAPDAAAVIGVGPSPYIYTASVAGSAVITGGTVSSIAILRQGVNVATGLTGGILPLSAGDQLIVNYSVAPTATWLPA